MGACELRGLCRAFAASHCAGGTCESGFELLGSWHVLAWTLGPLGFCAGARATAMPSTGGATADGGGDWEADRHRMARPSWCAGL